MLKAADGANRDLGKAHCPVNFIVEHVSWPLLLSSSLHGFLGFSRWGPIEYFRGVRKMLLRSGIRPLIPELPPAGSIAMRAEALARELFSTDASAFALVGHSMGGLDARYLITHLDPDRRVKSLLTIATPHRGTPMARWFLKARGPIPAWIQVYRQAWPVRADARGARSDADSGPRGCELRFLRKLSRALMSSHSGFAPTGRYSRRQRWNGPGELGKMGQVSRYRCARITWN